MRPILAVFIDGLKNNSLQKMPFLDSFQYKKRLRTDLGYSVTCHASMYTGLYPNRHKVWFVWKYQPETSPFKRLPESKILDLINFLPTRYFVGKIVHLFNQNTSYGGIGVMKYSSLRNWRYFDTAEKKLWNEDGYIEDIPTIFDILRENEISLQSVGLVNAKNHGGSLKYIQDYSVPKRISDLTYLFIGELDYVSHCYGQESHEAGKVLEKIDREVERVYEQFRNRLGSDPYLVCWSDHGHMMVKEQYDIYKHFERRGADLDKFINIVDTNFARFWFRNDEEHELITNILDDMPSGFILKQEHLKKYHTEMPDRRYGDLIYYLDYPYMFKKTVWGYGLRTKSIHGYLPDYPEKDGIFISNIPIEKEGHIELVDVTPSLIKLLQLNVKVTFDGTSIWA